MMVSTAYPALRLKLGDDGLLDLHRMLESAGREWKSDVIDTASDRFERRLGGEIGALRVELVTELSATRVEILRWSFAFWVAQLGASVGATAFLFYALNR